MGLFSRGNRHSQVGVDFLGDGVALVQVGASGRQSGRILAGEFIAAEGHREQVAATADWVRRLHLQKTPCVCLVASDDCDLFQVERPEVEAEELPQALAWKIKDLVNYEVANAVIDAYPMPRSNKNNQQQVGVVAARETVIYNYVSSIKSTALRLEALDIHDLARSNLALVRQSAGESLALLSLSDSGGLLSIYQHGDLHVSRELKIGIDQLAAVEGDSGDENVYEALLLDLQRSTDYYESFYGLGAVNRLRIFPQVKAVERMAMYLQNLTNYDIEFVGLDEDAELPPACFHAYCAALRGIAA